MSIPVSLRGDFKASQLRALARKTKDGPQARRLLALAAIYDGATRTEAARIGGVTLQIAIMRKPREPSRIVNTPPAKAGGFRLRLKAGLVRPLADSDGGCASSYLEIIIRFGRCLVLDIFGPYLIGNVSAAGDPISSAP